LIISGNGKYSELETVGIESQKYEEPIELIRKECLNSIHSWQIFKYGISSLRKSEWKLLVT